MFYLKRSITYIDGSTDNIESVYTNFTEAQDVIHTCLVNLHKPISELVVKFDSVDKEVK